MSNQIVISSGAKVRALEGVLTGTAGIVNALAINVPNGIPQLDGSGKILVSQLPNSVMEYKGTWNAATNTPTLANGTGNQGDVYLCEVAGTVNFGAGPISFFVGDQVVYSGSIWQRASGATGTVTSVSVTEDGDALTITGSPITTSGTINIGFSGTSGQYINGAGNLTTFPSLAGYVTSVTATAPLLSSGGTTPDLSIPAASGTVDGYLDNLDWTTFNNKQNAITLTTTGTTGAATLIGATLNIPNYSTDLSGYVPYIGATANVNLGTFDLTADVITGATGSFASSGGSNTFAINHSSGSGIALNITKGGAGEGIYINKTSGSGNAATIIGTLNATTLVKSGGTSSQFLKADGSVDASAYITLTSLSAGTGISYNNTTGVITSTITQYTDALARAAISLTTTGTSGAATYNSTTGVFNIPNYAPDLSGYVTLGTTQTITGAKTFTQNITGTAYISRIGASDTIGSGSNFNWANALTGANDRQLALQMNASNGLSLWYYDGTSWGSALGLNFLNNGRVQSTGLFNTFGSTSNRARNSFQSYNLDETAITGGWIAADFGDRGTTSDRIVVGSGFTNKAIIGAHNGLLTAWAHLYMQLNADANVNIGSSTDLGYKVGITGTLYASGLTTLGNNLTFVNSGIIKTDGTTGFIATYANGGGLYWGGIASTNHMFLSSAGNLMINSTTDAGYKLDVTGVGIFRKTNGDSRLIVYQDGATAPYTSTLELSSQGLGTYGATLQYDGGPENLTIKNYGRSGSGLSRGDIRFNTKISNTTATDVFVLNGFTGNATFTSSVQSTRYFNTFASANNNSRNSFQSYNLNEVSLTVGWIAADFGDTGTTSARVVMGCGFGNKAILGAHTGLLTAWADLYINPSANVIINTTSGVTGGGALQVNGNVNINGAFQINGVTIGGGGGSGITGSGTTNYIPKFSSGTSISNSVIYEASSSLAIAGTIVPAGGGAIWTAGTTLMGGNGNNKVIIGYLTSSTNSAIIAGHTSAVDNWAPLAISGTILNFRIAETDRMQLAASGNLLIGTTTDNGYKLQINGSASYAFGFLSIYRGSIGANDILVGNDGNRFYIGGNTYVAGSVTATNNVSVTGFVTATGGFFDTSDSRLKIVIKDYNQAKGIENVEARLYLKNNKKELGYFAQDVEEILPSAINKGEDGYLTLSYSQVHTAKIAYLEKEVAELKELIKSLL